MSRSDGREGPGLCTVGVAFLAAAGGRCYYEVEVLEAKGGLLVGFAGTNHGILKSEFVGKDACSWSFSRSTVEECTGVCGLSDDIVAVTPAIRPFPQEFVFHQPFSHIAYQIHTLSRVQSMSCGVAGYPTA
jgi:hypothetical protein